MNKIEDFKHGKRYVRAATLTIAIPRNDSDFNAFMKWSDQKDINRSKFIKVAIMQLWKKMKKG